MKMYFLSILFVFTYVCGHSQEEILTDAAKLDSIYQWMKHDRYPDSLFELEIIPSDSILSEECIEQKEEITRLQDSLKNQNSILEVKLNEIKNYDLKLKELKALIERQIEALKEDNEGISVEHLSQLEAHSAFLSEMGYPPANAGLILLFKKQRLAIIKAKEVLRSPESIKQIGDALNELKSEFIEERPFTGLNNSRGMISNKLKSFDVALCYLNSVFEGFEETGSTLGFGTNDDRLDELNRRIEFDRISGYEYLIDKYYELKETPGAYKNPLKSLKLKCD